MTDMNIVVPALKDLRSCAGVVLKYIAASFLALALYRGAVFVMEHRLDEEAVPVLISMFRLCLALYLAVAISAIQALFFSELGAHIDAPIWKYKGAGDALRRFFVPWLIINLTIITLFDMQVRLHGVGSGEVVAALEALILVAHMLALPVGACIMHWGALDWREFGAIIRPLIRLFQLTVVPVAFAFLLYALVVMRAILIGGDTVAALFGVLVTDIPLIAINAFIFVLVWRICMIYRMMPDEEEDPFSL